MDTGGRVILGLRLPSRSLQGCRTSKCWQIVLQALYQVCEQHLANSHGRAETRFEVRFRTFLHACAVHRGLPTPRMKRGETCKDCFGLILELPGNPIGGSLIKDPHMLEIVRVVGALAKRTFRK